VEKRDGQRVLVGKPEGRSPLGRSKQRLEENITMEVKHGGIDRTVGGGGARGVRGEL